MSTATTESPLVQIVEQSGLQKTKASNIITALSSFFQKAGEWNETIESIVITDPSETGKMKMAKEGRLFLKNLRLEGEKIVKAKREEIKARMADDVLEDKLWLKSGQMMEATFKNLESKLEEKEKFAERFEAERKEKLRSERLEILSPFQEFIPFGIENSLGEMPETEFEKILNGAKLQQSTKIEAERKAEEERIAREKAEAEERERIRQENERLRKEAEEREKALAEERAKAEAERKAIEEKARKEREEAEAIARKEREEQEAKLAAERKERERAEAELRAQKEAEEKARIEAEKKAEAERKAKAAEERKARLAPDKEKLVSLAGFLETLPIPEVKSEEAKKVIADVKILLAKTGNFLREKSEQI